MLNADTNTFLIQTLDLGERVKKKSSEENWIFFALNATFDTIQYLYLIGHDGSHKELLHDTHNSVNLYESTSNCSFCTMSHKSVYDLIL